MECGGLALVRIGEEMMRLMLQKKRQKRKKRLRIQLMRLQIRGNLDQMINFLMHKLMLRNQQQKHQQFQFSQLLQETPQMCRRNQQQQESTPRPLLTAFLMPSSVHFKLILRGLVQTGFKQTWRELKLRMLDF
ncbi:hypothetical protein Dimus_001512 [Dionaea muscipula]